MIITEIGRGLGNSMYVYAAAKALAEHHKTELKLDLSHLKSWPRFEKYGGAWYFELGKFNISSKEATAKEIRKFVLKTRIRIVDKLLRKYRLFERHVYHLPSSASEEELFEIPDNSFIWGYFGHERFFRSIKEKIIKEFTLKDEYKKRINPLLKKISKENSISLHVRRGDVLKLKNAYVLPLDFYKKAISLVKKRVKNPIFYVFSDDMEWCKQNFKNLGTKMTFIEGNEGYEDLELMRSCKHNILAVSALSWWAGYLNRNPEKIVIVPEHFSHFKNIRIDRDTLPKDWVKL